MAHKSEGIRTTSMLSSVPVLRDLGHKVLAILWHNDQSIYGFSLKGVIAISLVN